MNISSFESEFNKIMRRDYFTSHVKPIREQAFNNFLEKGLPNKNWEDWRHTDLKPIKEIDFRLSEISDAPAHELEPFEFASGSGPIHRKRRSELRLRPSLPHTPGARMTVVTLTPSKDKTGL